MATVWKAARKIASPALAPRNKYFSKAKDCNPELDEWRSFLKSDGHLGGCPAFEVSIDEIIQQEDYPIGYVMSGDLSEAEIWYSKTAKRVAQLGLRKGIPPDDVPTEILRLVFCASPGVVKSAGRGGCWV